MLLSALIALQNKSVNNINDKSIRHTSIKKFNDEKKIQSHKSIIFHSVISLDYVNFENNILNPFTKKIMELIFKCITIP